MRKIITCACGRQWFADDPDLYYEIRVIHGPAMPPEGFSYEGKYYCRDCLPF